MTIGTEVLLSLVEAVGEGVVPSGGATDLVASKITSCGEFLAPLMEKMHAGPHIEGLLHLGALALAVSLAYLGLDRLGEFRDPVARAIDMVREDIRAEIEKRGFMSDGQLDSPLVLQIPRIQFLLYLARIRTPGVGKEELGVRIRRNVRRFLEFPEMLSFSKGLHKIPIAIWAIFDAILYTQQVYGSLHENHGVWALSPTGLEWSFWLFLLLPTLVIAVVWFSKRLGERLRRKGNGLIEEAAEIFKRQADHQKKQSIDKAGHDVVSVAVTQNSCPVLQDHGAAPSFGCPLVDSSPWPNFCPGVGIPCPGGANSA